MPDKSLTRYTAAESYKLWRWQRGMSQEEAATCWGMSRATLQRREQGIVVDPLVGIGPLSMPLQLRLARHRAGYSLGRLKQALDLSHVTILKMEREGAETLRIFYEKRGFTFAS